jgi:hypothetical protein
VRNLLQQLRQVGRALQMSGERTERRYSPHDDGSENKIVRDGGCEEMEMFTGGVHTSH